MNTKRSKSGLLKDNCDVDKLILGHPQVIDPTSELLDQASKRVLKTIVDSINNNELFTMYKTTDLGGHGDVKTMGWEDDDCHVTWLVEDLWKAVAGTEVTALPIEELLHCNENYKRWGNGPEHNKRVCNANTDYPLILSKHKGKTGKWIMLDGYHRLHRMVCTGVKTVLVQFIDEMPLPISIAGHKIELTGINYKWQEKA